MHQTLVIGKFIELRALCLPVGNESLPKVCVDDIDLLEFRVGRVIYFIQCHFQRKPGCLLLPKNKACLS